MKTSEVKPDYKAIYETALKEANDEWIDKIEAVIDELKDDEDYKTAGNMCHMTYVVELLETLIGG